MNNKSLYLFLCLVIISCAKKPKELIGTWQVKSPYYKASYTIEENNNSVVAKVLYYNDDTFIYKGTSSEKDIFLKDLQYKNDTEIDAVSGATNTSTNYTLKLKSKDTLLVTKYIKNKPLTEIWIKKKSHEN